MTNLTARCAKSIFSITCDTLAECWKAFKEFGDSRFPNQEWSFEVSEGNAEPEIVWFSEIVDKVDAFIKSMK